MGSSRHLITSPASGDPTSLWWLKFYNLLSKPEAKLPIRLSGHLDWSNQVWIHNPHFDNSSQIKKDLFQTRPLVIILALTNYCTNLTVSSIILHLTKSSSSFTNVISVQIFTWGNLHLCSKEETYTSARTTRLVLISVCFWYKDVYSIGSISEISVSYHG